jgi:hypothetical protein
VLTGSPAEPAPAKAGAGDDEREAGGDGDDDRDAGDDDGEAGDNDGDAGGDGEASITPGRVTGTVPSASARLRRRTLAARLTALAERHIRELCPPPGEPMRPIAELCVADVDLSRVPRAAIEDFLKHREPPREDAKPRRRGRGRRSAGDEHHAWMLGRER